MAFVWEMKRLLLSLMRGRGEKQDIFIRILSYQQAYYGFVCQSDISFCSHPVIVVLNRSWCFGSRQTIQYLVEHCGNFLFYYLILLFDFPRVTFSIPFMARQWQKTHSNNLCNVFVGKWRCEKKITWKLILFLQ